MAFDNPTRNRLARLVSDCRRLLTDEFSIQLQQHYGIQPDGQIIPLEQLGHLDDEQRGVAAMLRERISHIASGLTDEKRPAEAAVDRLLREQAFTVLNRFAALRMCEERELVQECVRGGLHSRGFKVFLQIAGSGLGDTWQRYRTFLYLLFDEISIDLGLLFDRFSPFGLLFPREAALEELFQLLNTPDLQSIWSEDETIGWIYQYFNSKEERQAMRKASAAPRNSRELAVRNQFFTPRYVVEFLTDNTLGRTWYEMRQGQTRLTGQCRYLVRRPHEVFLQPGEEAPEPPANQDDLSQEELLRQPHPIAFRPKKDPRDLKILDPACGSGHFLLYAFDLLQTIYEEAWEDDSMPAGETTGLTLRHDYPDREKLLLAIPELILRHNLHGIDIDPRAVQIAALALWLRSQRAWKEQRVKPEERPRIRKSHIVCAEPMPGEKQMLREFAANLQPPLLGQIVERIFDRMQLAGEAGSLLKIEEEIQESISQAKEQWQRMYERARDKFGNQMLFTQSEMDNLRLDPQLLLGLFDVSQISDAEFWETIEERILAALREYAERSSGQSLSRRMFADDAAKGFAFIDLCRKRYDVVLMNPPFGEGAIATRLYLDEKFSKSKTDIGMAMVSRFAVKMLKSGKLGTITNRVMIANESLSEWRLEYLLGEITGLYILLDLGIGVLDEALVEASAYVLSKSILKQDQAQFISILDESDKSKAVNDIFNNMTSSHRTFYYSRALEFFRNVPSYVLAYQLPVEFLMQIASGESFVKKHGEVAVGLQPSDDFRFVRLAWEILPSTIGESNTWSHYAKGGEYSPYWDDIHLVVNWKQDGHEINNFIDDTGKLKSRPQNRRFYYKEGITYPERTTSDFSPRVLPKGCIISVTGQGIFCCNPENNYLFIVGAYSRAYKLLVESIFGSGDCSVSGSAATHYRSQVIGKLPSPIINNTTASLESTKRLITLSLSLFSNDETTKYFLPFHLVSASLREAAVSIWIESVKRYNEIVEIQHKIESLLIADFKLSTQAISALNKYVGIHPLEYPINNDITLANKIVQLIEMTDNELVQLSISRLGARRQLTKKSYIINRKLELISHLLSIDFTSLCNKIISDRIPNPDILLALSRNAVSFSIGIIFARWDIRLFLESKTPSTLNNPFGALPKCSPAMLKGPDYFPATPNSITNLLFLQPQKETDLPPNQTNISNPTIRDEEYPIRISWQGILVDDAFAAEGNTHQEDILRRTREVIEVLWKERAPAIEQEACEILGVKSLRDYFRKPGGFFQDHLKRYSKSRRQAPIYWPLSSENGNYTLWIYYHRLTDQFLYTCANDYVNPRIEEVTRDIEQFQKRQLAGAIKSADSLKQLEALQDFLIELKNFRDELLAVAQLPYKPDLNDGVIITAAPLWKLFRLPKWRKDLKACWEKLQAGDYDWAHLTLAIWPDRVRAKCVTDKSLAIAHDLEHLYDESRAPRRKRSAPIEEENEEENIEYEN